MARWAGHVAGLGDIKDVYVVFMGILKESGRLEDLGVGGRIILKRILKN